MTANWFPTYDTPSCVATTICFHRWILSDFKIKFQPIFSSSSIIAYQRQIKMEFTFPSIDFIGRFSLIDVFIPLLPFKVLIIGKKNAKRNLVRRTFSDYKIYSFAVTTTDYKCSNTWIAYLYELVICIEICTKYYNFE